MRQSTLAIVAALAAPLAATPALSQQAGSAAQPQPAPQQQMTPQQQQAAQVVQGYLAMRAADAYAQKCQPYPAGESILLDAQIEGASAQLQQAGVDVSANVQQAVSDVQSAECGAEQFEGLYEAVGSQLAAPIDVLVLSFADLSPECRGSLIDGDAGQNFDGLADRRRARHAEGLPEQLAAGVEQTSGALADLCESEDPDRMAQARDSVEVAAVEAALNDFGAP